MIFIHPHLGMAGGMWLHGEAIPYKGETIFFTLDHSAFGILITWLPCLHTYHVYNTYLVGSGRLRKMGLMTQPFSIMLLLSCIFSALNWYTQCWASSMSILLLNSEIYGVMRRGKDAEPITAESGDDDRHRRFWAVRSVSSQMCIPR